MCLGPLELLAADEQVYLFVVEGHQARDGLELAGREVIGPRRSGCTVSPARTDQYRLVVPLYGQLVTVPLGIRWSKLISVELM